MVAAPNGRRLYADQGQWFDPTDSSGVAFSSEPPRVAASGD
jgi:hypothetical protein